MSLLLTIAFAAWPVGQYIFGCALNDILEGQAVVILPDGTYDTSHMWWWIWFFLLFAVVRGVVLYGTTIARMTLGGRILCDLREKIFAQVQYLDSAYHREHGAGEIIARTTRDSDKVREAMFGAISQLAEVVVMIGSSIILLYWYHMSLGAVVSVLLLFALIILWRQTYKLSILNRATDDSYDGVVQQLTEGVEAVRVIKTFRMEQPRLQAFTDQVRIYSAHSARVIVFIATRMSIPQLIVALGHVWILLMGVQLVSEGVLAVGDLVAALMVMTTIIFRLDGISLAARQLADARASVDRLNEFFAQESVLQSGTRPLPEGPLGLVCKQVSVSGTTNNHVLLNNCSFTIQPGEIVAVVGSTGSGKSTLCSLFSRLRDPDSGSVSLLTESGEEFVVTGVEKSALRRAVQVVFQESFLLSRSLVDNIELGQTDRLNADDLQTILTQSAADTIVGEMEDGAQTLIGERGVTLSGGQKQRMCIARALVKKPRILVLDDSTSALDALTEERIIESLHAESGDTTVVLITSRIASVQLAQRVIVLDRGEVIATGTHEQLLETEAAYRALLCVDDRQTEGATDGSF